MKKDILMAIKPEYAEAILSGKKTLELRRRPPAREVKGQSCFIYSSSPCRSVIGRFTVGRTVSANTLSEFWAKFGEQSNVSEALFREYFKGKNSPYGIEVINPERIEPVPLSKLRAFPAFTVPQSYRYLKDGETYL